MWESRFNFVMTKLLGQELQAAAAERGLMLRGAPQGFSNISGALAGLVICGTE